MGEQAPNLEKVMERLHVAKTKLLFSQYGNMSPSEIVDYMIKHPESDSVKEYVIKHVGRSFAEQVTFEFERRFREERVKLNKE